MIKCTFKPNGYSQTQCKGLQEVSELKPMSRSNRKKGLLFSNVVDINTGADKGIKFAMYTNGYLSNGLILNVCPFCAGPLRDTSEDFNN